MDNGYDDNFENERKSFAERDKTLMNLSTADRIRYRKLENDYEIDKQSGADVPEDKQQYILSQIFKNRR